MSAAFAEIAAKVADNVVYLSETAERERRMLAFQARVDELVKEVVYQGKTHKFECRRQALIRNYGRALDGLGWK